MGPGGMGRVREPGCFCCWWWLLWSAVGWRSPTRGGGGVKNRALEEARSADRDRLNQNSEEQCPVVDTGPRTVALHLTQLR